MNSEKQLDEACQMYEVTKLTSQIISSLQNVIDEAKQFSFENNISISEDIESLQKEIDFCYKGFQYDPTLHSKDDYYRLIDKLTKKAQDASEKSSVLKTLLEKNKVCIKILDKTGKVVNGISTALTILDFINVGVDSINEAINIMAIYDRLYYYADMMNKISTCTDDKQLKLSSKEMLELINNHISIFEFELNSVKRQWMGLAQGEIISSIPYVGIAVNLSTTISSLLFGYDEITKYEVYTDIYANISEILSNDLNNNGFDNIYTNESSIGFYTCYGKKGVNVFKESCILIACRIQAENNYSLCFKAIPKWIIKLSKLDRNECINRLDNHISRIENGYIKLL